MLKIEDLTIVTGVRSIRELQLLACHVLPELPSAFDVADLDARANRDYVSKLAVHLSKWSFGDGLIRSDQWCKRTGFDLGQYRRGLCRTAAGRIYQRIANLGNGPFHQVFALQAPTDDPIDGKQAAISIETVEIDSYLLYQRF